MRRRSGPRVRADYPDLVREHDGLQPVAQPDLEGIPPTWDFTVASETNRRVAISAFEGPSATATRTSRSRSVRDEIPAGSVPVSWSPPVGRKRCTRRGAGR